MDIHEFTPTPDPKRRNCVRCPYPEDHPVHAVEALVFQDKLRQPASVKVTSFEQAYEVPPDPPYKIGDKVLFPDGDLKEVKGVWPPEDWTVRMVFGATTETLAEFLGVEPGVIKEWIHSIDGNYQVRFNERVRIRDQWTVDPEDEFRFDPRAFAFHVPEDEYRAQSGGHGYPRQDPDAKPASGVTIDLTTHTGDSMFAGYHGRNITSLADGACEDPTPIDEYIVSYMDEPRGGVVKDVAFNRKSFGPGQPENPDQGNIYVGTDGLRVTLEQDFRDEELQHFFSYAINATRGIDPENPPEPVDWEEMMRGGLQTALKRINIAFAVYGASRTATHQIVRSTRANFHQQSQRAHYYGDRPSVRMPESWLKEGWHDGPQTLSEVEMTDSLVGHFQDLAEHAASVYKMATDAGVSYQDARFALLEGTTNFILCEYSLDEFINVYAYRGCSMFQWEIVYIMREMRRVLVEAHPWLEPYIKISCEKTKGAKDNYDADDPSHTTWTPEHIAHTCTFQGWEEVEGQCDFPWARDSNRAFRSERHVIKNNAKEDS
jgi:hypothetical protein